MEKVWKAEQKAEAEAKKIEQLRRELEEERAREDMQRHAIDQGVLRYAMIKTCSCINVLATVCEPHYKILLFIYWDVIRLIVFDTC